MVSRPQQPSYGEGGAPGSYMVDKRSCGRSSVQLEVLLGFAKDLAKRTTSTFVRYSAEAVSMVIDHVITRQAIAEEIKPCTRRCQSLFVILQHVDQVVGDAVRLPTFCSPEVMNYFGIIIHAMCSGVRRRPSCTMLPKGQRFEREGCSST